GCYSRRLFLERLPKDDLVSPVQDCSHGQELPQVNGIAARHGSRQEQQTSADPNAQPTVALAGPSDATGSPTFAQVASFSPEATTPPRTPKAPSSPRGLADEQKPPSLTGDGSPRTCPAPFS